ncbi:PKD domain-containing protein [Georgenia satyanarayanai]|uniref:PKD domain-containing protein n=1 Tax=Georgenia satyanarayanai TaxID=860221 RepID=UPI00126505C9|nr:PKD domain-containing protein [Georgenia satyanarayanai]
MGSTTVNTSRTSAQNGARLRRFLALVLALALATTVTLVALGPPSARADSRPADPANPATPVTVTADALPTPQIDGVVWSVAMAGNTVYAGGSFTTARPAGAPAGQNTVARANMVAFDVTTGQLTSFAPTFNQQVRTVAVSPDNRRLYVGGQFTSVNGQTRQRIAAFDTATGALLQSFAPPLNYHVHAIVATNTTVYVGGNFTSVGSTPRGRLAAFSAATGALLDWAPQVSGGTVDAITIDPQGTKVAVGGGFTALNGSSNPGYGLGMVDAVTGANLPFEANAYVRNGTTDGAIDTLATDGEYIYGGGWTFGRSGGTWEGVFAASWDDGKVHWLNDCHGDTYGVFPVGDVVYAASHTHYCENVDGMRQGPGGVGEYPYHRAVAFGRDVTGTVSWEPDQRRYYSFAGQPASTQLGWFPSLNTGTYTGQYQGPWSVVGNADYVVMGGEFTRVNGTNQQGLVRFAVADKAPNSQGPSLFNASYPLNLTSTAAGQVRVNWRTNQDIDNENLTYRVYRDSQNGAGLLHTRTVESRYWNPFTMGFTDTGLTPGATHRYRVAVTDPFGNVANSPWTTVTVAASGADSAYVRAVRADEPTDYWRLGEAAGPTLADAVGFHPLTAAAGILPVSTGAIAGDSDGAMRFNGTNTGWAATTTQGNPPDVFTVETWFRTTTKTGGRLVGWSNRSTQGSSSKHDRQLYMDSSGRIHFGVKPNASRLVVTSPTGFNDGGWHHAVATLSKDGMALYLDGKKVGGRSDVTVGEHLALGYWRIGGDTVSGWPSAPSTPYFSGELDEVAIYKRALSAADVAAHYAAGTGTEAPNVAPTAAFTATATGLAVAVDGRDSADPDGTITSHAWTFGDGASATGAEADHTYAAAGTYDVTLTVTDDDGASTSLTKQVTVAPVPNAAPTAAFTVTTDGLAVAVDGRGSSDPDGTVASHAWTFGDGASATGAEVDHTYAAAGTYDVTLTVTDDEGATDSLTRQVSVSTAPVAFAQDAFARSLTGGWGTADVGGGWSPIGSAANFSVVDGTGRIRMGSPGAGPGMRLTGVASTDTDLRVRVGSDKAATGGGTYLTAQPRVVPNGDRYFTDVRLLSTGGVQLIVGRAVGGAETNLRSVSVAGLTVTPGELLHLRTQAVGTSPTTLRARVWAAGTPEPDGWTVAVTDSTAGLQAAGGVGLRTYLSGSSTNAPVLALFDDLWAGPSE